MVPTSGSRTVNTSKKSIAGSSDDERDRFRDFRLSDQTSNSRASSKAPTLRAVTAAYHWIRPLWIGPSR